MACWGLRRSRLPCTKTSTACLLTWGWPTTDDDQGCIVGQQPTLPLQTLRLPVELDDFAVDDCQPPPYSIRIREIALFLPELLEWADSGLFTRDGTGGGLQERFEPVGAQDNGLHCRRWQDTLHLELP